jgi:hypothetical protein
MQINLTKRLLPEDPVIYGSPKKPNLFQQTVENQNPQTPAPPLRKRNWSSHCVGSILSKTCAIERIIYSDGIYEGEVDENRMPKGQGRLVKSTGEIFEGVFVGNSFVEGIYRNPQSNADYKGSFQNNKPHGFGKMTVTGVFEYEGNFHEGFFYGKGRLSFYSGLIIVSHFFNDKINGSSIITLPNKTILEGNIKALINSSNCLIYTEVFAGTIRYPNGDLYKGPIKNEMLDGNGQFYTKARNWWQHVTYQNGKIISSKPVLRDL